MGKFKFLTKGKISKLPKNPGVYIFKSAESFCILGKLQISGIE